VRDFLAFSRPPTRFCDMAAHAGRGHAGHRRGAIYPRYARSSTVHSLDVIEESTIKPQISEDGRSRFSLEPA
jgi:hypothetical protein